MLGQDAELVVDLRMRRPLPQYGLIDFVRGVCEPERTTDVRSAVGPSLRAPPFSVP